MDRQGNTSGGSGFGISMPNGADVKETSCAGMVRASPLLARTYCRKSVPICSFNSTRKRSVAASFTNTAFPALSVPVRSGYRIVTGVTVGRALGGTKQNGALVAPM